MRKRRERKRERVPRGFRQGRDNLNETRESWYQWQIVSSLLSVTRVLYVSDKPLLLHPVKGSATTVNISLYPGGEVDFGNRGKIVQTDRCTKGFCRSDR